MILLTEIHWIKRLVPQLTADPHTGERRVASHNVKTVHEAVMQIVRKKIIFKRKETPEISHM
jgi:hypothetical protein